MVFDELTSKLQNGNSTFRVEVKWRNRIKEDKRVTEKFPRKHEVIVRNTTRVDLKEVNGIRKEHET